MHRYKKVNHLLEYLERQKGNTLIPEDIISTIRISLKGKESNTYNVRKILKDLNMQKYYEDIPSILKALNISKTSDITTRQNEDEFECCICLQTNIKMIAKLCCNHEFCDYCVNEIIKAAGDNTYKCPICRKENIRKTLADEHIDISKLSFEQIEKLTDDFKRVAEVYDKISVSTGKTNIMSYSYVVNKLLQLQGIHIPNTSSNNSTHDDIWHQIRTELNW